MKRLQRFSLQRPLYIPDSLKYIEDTNFGSHYNHHSIAISYTETLYTQIAKLKDLIIMAYGLIVRVVSGLY